MTSLILLAGIQLNVGGNKITEVRCKGNSPVVCPWPLRSATWRPELRGYMDLRTENGRRLNGVIEHQYMSNMMAVQRINVFPEFLYLQTCNYHKCDELQFGYVKSVNAQLPSSIDGCTVWYKQGTSKTPKGFESLKLP